MNGFNAADELVLFEVCGLDISIAPDGVHLCVDGPRDVIAAAEYKIRAHKAELFAELRRRAATTPRHTAP